MSRLIFLAALAAVAATAACGERADPGPTAPPDAASPDAASRGGVAEVHVTDIQRAGRAAEERLARRMAMALADPGFRAYVKGALDHSTVREHKLHFRRLLEGQGARGMQALARAGREAPSVVQSDVGAASALEFYMPVPAHRAAWRGDDRVLVATARADHEAPVAFDVRGRRQRTQPRHPTRHACPRARARRDRLRLRPAELVAGAAPSSTAAVSSHRPLHDGCALSGRL